MKEKFVRINTIEGYENVKDCYWISNSDEDVVINRDTGKIMKTRLDKYGYLRVNLITIRGEKKTCYLHILKAKAFICGPNPLGYNVVRHLNDVKNDNRLENLAWGTQSDNVRDSIRNGNFNYEDCAKAAAMGGKATGAKNGKKSSKPVRCIETGITYPSTREAERQLGIHNASINHCCSGRYKTAGGLHWEFVDKEE